MVCALGSLGVATLAARGGAASSDRETVGAKPETRDCRVGARPTSPLVSPEEGATVLGCGRTGDGTELELYGVRDAGGPCLSLAGLPGGTRACGRAPSGRVPEVRRAIGGPAFVQRSPRGPIEVYGETTANIRQVTVSYRLPDGPRHRKAATLIRASDRRALAKAGVRKPFGYFVGSVPPRAVEISAEARGCSGKVLARLAYDRLVGGMHPTVFISRKPSPS